jgi:hypothetical protein
MNYQIKILFKDDKQLKIKGLVYTNGESAEVISNYNMGENLAYFTDRLKAELDIEFKNRVVSEKKVIPNVAPDEEKAEFERAEKEIRALRDSGFYIEQVFEGKQGTGKSTRGGAYAQKHGLKIYKVINQPNKETWFYKE